MAAGDPAESLLKSKHLYLFEVLVKSVDIKEKLLDETERENIFKNALKVRIIFSDFYDVEINEVKDIKSIHLPQPEQVKCHSKMTKMFSTNNETISKGKDDKVKTDDEQIDFIKKSSEHSRRAGFSCLFPMNPVHLIQKLKTSYLYLMVYGNCGMDSERKTEIQKIIGQAKVSIRSNFIDSVQYALSIDEFPTTASLATTCNVRNSFQEKTGKIDIYVRLSCFGKYIISMFNMMKNNPQSTAANAQPAVQQATNAQAANVTKTPEKRTGKVRKKPIKEKRLNKTECLKSTKFDTAQPTTVSSQTPVNRIEVAAVQTAQPAQPSTQPAVMERTASSPPAGAHTAPSPSASSANNINTVPSLQPTAINPAPAPPRALKLHSASSRSAMNLIANVQSQEPTAMNPPPAPSRASTMNLFANVLSQEPTTMNPSPAPSRASTMNLIANVLSQEPTTMNPSPAPSRASTMNLIANVLSQEPRTMNPSPAPSCASTMNLIANVLSQEPTTMNPSPAPSCASTMNLIANVLSQEPTTMNPSPALSRASTMNLIANVLLSQQPTAMNPSRESKPHATSSRSAISTPRRKRRKAPSQHPTSSKHQVSSPTRSRTSTTKSS